MLYPPRYADECVHKSKATARGVVAAPNKPDRPSLLLYRLGDSEFVKGMALKNFNAVQDRQECAVLLAPSGAGKTRKIYELLHSGFGYFIPFKTYNDKNDGSVALARVLNLLQNDPLVDWEKENPSLSLYELRRQRAVFAIRCVLISFTEVFRNWTAAFRPTESIPVKWLLLQLFPEVYLRSDVFADLAIALYRNCDPQEVLNYSHFRDDFYVVLDEAQVLGTILKNKFLTSTPGKRESLGLRPVLSVILHETKDAVKRLPILAGTDMTLLEEWTSIITTMGVKPDFIFTDFPLLDFDEVKAMLKQFLVVRNELDNLAANWLIGRPRWVAQFITEAIEGNKFMTEHIYDFVRSMTRDDDDSRQPQPRTIFASFQRLARKQLKAEIAGQTISNPYDAALQDAFLLSMGFPILPRESPLLLELGVGFTVAGAPQKTILNLEPVVLETCRLLVQNDLKFRMEFLRSVSEDKANLGKRFEIIAAEGLLNNLTSLSLETHPILKDVELPAVFRGNWEMKLDHDHLYGKVARKASGSSEFYKTQNESILFPDDYAGPDAILMLRKRAENGQPSGPQLTILMQDKVRVNFDFDKALLSVNPFKLHHTKRGKIDEAVVAGVAEAHESYLSNLRDPVIRVIVSVLKPFEGDHVQLIPNGRGSHDLLLILDTTNGHLVYGHELWDYVRRCRFF